MIKWILKQFTICLVKYLQKYYRCKSEKWLYEQTDQHINRLILIQSILYFLRENFQLGVISIQVALGLSQIRLSLKNCFLKRNSKNYLSLYVVTQNR